jgi:hypothetical protein
MKRLLTTLLLTAAALPAAALVPTAVEVDYTVGMPLAVTEVVEVGVPAPQVEQVVYRLNTAQVPVVESVEIVRYSAFPMVVDRYQPAQPLYYEPQGLDVEWELDELDMLTLLAAHFDDGLQGELLADAVLRDVALLGFDVGVDGRLYAAPRPVRRDFLYYVEPGYRFTTDRGLFRQRVVVVDDDDFVDYRQRRRARLRDGRLRIVDRDPVRVVRDRDRVTLWDRIFRRDRVRDRDRVLRDRDRVVRDRVVLDRERERRRQAPAAVPPGHAKHGPGGPHPTPGHVKHAGPGGPPGHSGDGVRRDRDDDRRRRVVVRERDGDRRRRVDRDRGNDRPRVDRDRGERRRNRAERRDDRGRGRGNAAAGPPDRGRGRGNDEARGKPGRGQGQGKAKGKDKGKGRGQGRGH